MVERLFLAVPWGCLRFVIVVFPDHTHLLLFMGLFLTEIEMDMDKRNASDTMKKSILSILQYQRNFGHFDYTYIFKLFDVIVTPVLCYAG